jgi:hypothetical protein
MDGPKSPKRFVEVICLSILKFLLDTHLPN